MFPAHLPVVITLTGRVSVTSACGLRRPQVLLLEALHSLVCLLVTYAAFLVAIVPFACRTGFEAEFGALRRLHESRLLMARLPDMLEAPPVQLHRWRRQHVAALIDAVNASRPELAVWMPWAKEEPTPEEYAAVLTRFDEAFDAGTEFVFGIFEPRVGLAGGCGLHLRGEPEVAEIGYWVRTDCHRRGYATAAACALTTAAFEHLDAVDAVYITMDEANLASARVAARLGYRLEKTEAREVLAPGHTGKGPSVDRRTGDLVPLKSRGHPPRPPRPDGADRLRSGTAAWAISEGPVGMCRSRRPRGRSSRAGTRAATGRVEMRDAWHQTGHECPRSVLRASPHSDFRGEGATMCA